MKKLSHSKKMAFGDLYPIDQKFKKVFNDIEDKMKNTKLLFGGSASDSDSYVELEKYGSELVSKKSEISSYYTDEE